MGSLNGGERGRTGAGGWRWRWRWAAAVGVLLGVSVLWPSVAPETAAHRAITARRWCRCLPDTSLTIERGDGIRLAARVYGSRNGHRPPLLLLHGLTPQGQRLPIYPVLARALADRGFLVMTVDFAGFGESGDPYAAQTTSALDWTRDVRAALEVLRRLPAAGPEPVVLVGHSMGAIEALAVGLTDPRVGSVVLLGPPRRTAEVLASDSGRTYHWNRIRWTYQQVYHRPMPAWFTRETFLALKGERDIERWLPVLEQPGHRPVLLLDSGKDDPKDLEYLRGYASRVAPPSSYATVPGTDHYLGARSQGEVYRFDPAAVGFVADTIAGWEQGRKGGKAGGRSGVVGVRGGTPRSAGLTE